jgi:large subunit ribosomal protein L6
MSRIGNLPVAIPQGVTIDIKGQQVTAKGKLGMLSLDVGDDVTLKHEKDVITVEAKSVTKRARMAWGSARANISNIVRGVSTGFNQALEINGVGYRAALAGKELVLTLGYSHEIRYPIPEGISVKVERPTAIAISGVNKQKVGQVAAEIRAFRPPEPYKGKGIKYANEYILRKEGKKK